MNTTLIRAEHSETPGETVFEVWWDGRLVGCLYGMKGRPGIRLLSKHMTLPVPSDDFLSTELAIMVDPNR